MKEAAGKVLSETEEKKQLPEARIQLLKKRREMKEKACRDSVENVEISNELKEITKLCRKQAKADMEEKRKQRMQAMLEADQRGDSGRAAKLTRELGGTWIGPRKRDYRKNALDVPTAEEWRAAMEARGHEGGYRCQAVNFEKMKETIMNTSQIEERPVSSSFITRACERLKRCLHNAKMARASPPWAVPAEVWAALLGKKGKKAKREGIGRAAEDAKAEHVEEAIKKICTNIYARSMEPLAWLRSFAVPADKGNGQKGTSGMRIFHLFDPMAKAFQRATEKKEEDGEYFMYGYRRGMRREGAITVQLAAAWRATTKGRTAIFELNDMAKAFQCISHEKQAEAAAELYGENDAAIARWRQQCSVMSFETNEGWVDLRLGEGTAIGGANAAREFSEVFRTILNEWQESDEARVAAVWIRNPVDGLLYDTSITNFADDICRRTEAKTLDAADKTRQKTDDKINEILEAKGLKQNIQKKVMLAKAGGRGSRVAIAHFYRGNDRRKKKTAKYLGIKFSTDETNNAEIDARLLAARQNFASLKPFWREKAPIHIVRTVFKSKILSVLITGLSALVLTKKDAERLDNTLVALARAALGGSGRREKQKITKAMKAEEVRRKMKIGKAETEVRMARIGWLKEITKNPQRNGQLIAAVWGREEGGGEDSEELDEKQTPWAAQWRNDVRLLLLAAEEEATWNEIESDWSVLWRDTDEQDKLHRTDQAILRAKERTFEIPPPSSNTQRATQVETEQTPRTHICTHRYVDHTLCNAAFETKRGLECHRRRKHGETSELWQLCVSNGCPSCSSAFVSRQQAAQHLSGAIINGVCWRNRSLRACTIDRMDDEHRCRVCNNDVIFENWTKLSEHIRERHLPKIEIKNAYDKSKPQNIEEERTERDGNNNRPEDSQRRGEEAEGRQADERGVEDRQENLMTYRRQGWRMAQKLRGSRNERERCSIDSNGEGDNGGREEGARNTDETNERRRPTDEQRRDNDGNADKDTGGTTPTDAQCERNDTNTNRRVSTNTHKPTLVDRTNGEPRSSEGLPSGVTNRRSNNIANQRSPDENGSDEYRTADNRNTPTNRTEDGNEPNDSTDTNTMEVSNRGKRRTTKSTDATSTTTTTNIHRHMGQLSSSKERTDAARHKHEPASVREQLRTSGHGDMDTKGEGERKEHGNDRGKTRQDRKIDSDEHGTNTGAESSNTTHRHGQNERSPHETDRGSRCRIRERDKRTSTTRARVGITTTMEDETTLVGDSDEHGGQRDDEKQGRTVLATARERRQRGSSRGDHDVQTRKSLQTEREETSDKHQRHARHGGDNHGSSSNDVHRSEEADRNGATGSTREGSADANRTKEVRTQRRWSSQQLARRRKKEEEKEKEEEKKAEELTIRRRWKILEKKKTDKKTKITDYFCKREDNKE